MRAPRRCRFGAMTNNLSVVINADAQQVWTMLREPSLVAQWHGWDADDLGAEIKRDLLQHRRRGRTRPYQPDRRRRRHLRPAPRPGGHRSQHHPGCPGPRLRMGRLGRGHHPGLAHVPPPAALRAGAAPARAPADALLLRPRQRRVRDREAGARGFAARRGGVLADLATGEKISGKVWFSSNHQVGLTVHSYAEHGDGLLIVADQPAIPEIRPDGGSMVIVSTYDLGAHHWTSSGPRGTTGGLRTTATSEPLH